MSNRKFTCRYAWNPMLAGMIAPTEATWVALMVL
jgi:hypothetical protein